MAALLQRMGLAREVKQGQSCIVSDGKGGERWEAVCALSHTQRGRGREEWNLEWVERLEDK